MTKSKNLNLYPLWQVYRPNGSCYVQCVSRLVADGYAYDIKGTVRLEDRKPAWEVGMPADRVAEIDLMYAAALVEA
jgi:hypothetical protein